MTSLATRKRRVAVVGGDGRHDGLAWPSEFDVSCYSVEQIHRLVTAARHGGVDTIVAVTAFLSHSGYAKLKKLKPFATLVHWPHGFARLATPDELRAVAGAPDVPILEPLIRPRPTPPSLPAVAAVDPDVTEIRALVAAGDRAKLGERLVVVRGRWPKASPKARGWSEFLERAGLAKEDALAAMRGGPRPRRFPAPATPPERVAPIAAPPSTIDGVIGGVLSAALSAALAPLVAEVRAVRDALEHLGEPAARHAK